MDQVHIAKITAVTVATIKCAVTLGLVVCAIGGASAAAQSGQITGLVLDATGGMLPGATVTLSGGPDGLREAKTDASGRFAFTVVAGSVAASVALAAVDPDRVREHDGAASADGCQHP